MVIIFKKILIKLSSFTVSVCILMIMFSFSLINVSAATSTGVGLSEHVMNAYYNDWIYVYGAATQGKVDCSGLIVTYNGVGGIRTSMVSSSPEVGYVSNGIPRIHGLGLYQPGHVGVYVGSGMAVDARDEYSNIVYQEVSKKNWVKWFKVYGVTYPESGWVKFQGNYFYYENGQYIINTSRVINGEEYNFNSLGYSDKIPTSTDVTSVSIENSSNNSSENTSSSVTNSSKPNNDTTSSNNTSSAIINSSKPISNINSSSEQQSNTLQYGSSGDKVLKLQNRLKELGYFEDDATGYYGSYTKNCVKEFQGYSGINATGIADECTQNLLYSDDALEKYVTYTVGSYDDEVTNIQNRLIALQYFNDEATGYYGDMTKIAIEDFQRENGLNVTGKADKETQVLLFSDKVKINPNAGTLKYGMNGDNITLMQERLIELRYLTGTPTNVYDDNTNVAVKLFLSSNGFNEAEEITKEQLEVLYSSSAVKSPDYNNLKYGYKGDDVEVLQNSLTLLNYYNTDITSVFDEETQKAVIASQRDFGMEETGIADSEYMQVLSEKVGTFELDIANRTLTQKATLASEKMAKYADANVTIVNYDNASQSFTETDRIIIWSIIGGMFSLSLILLLIFVIKNRCSVEADKNSEKIVVGRFNSKLKKNKKQKDIHKNNKIK